MRLTSFFFSFLLLAGVVLGQGPPINDECSGWLPVVVGRNPVGLGCPAYTNVGATTSAGFGTLCSAINSDVWFSFVAPASCAYTIDTNPVCDPLGIQLQDTVLAVYTSCSATSYLACDDDSGTGFLSSLTLAMTAGSLYWIRVGDFGATVNQGTFNITITPPIALSFSSPLGSGSVQANITCGTPNGFYFFVPTVQSQASNTWFFGLYLPFQEVLDLFNTGPPFRGTLNGAGGMTVGPVSGLPFAISIYAVVLNFGTSGYIYPISLTNVVTYVVP